jgi:hypothetical protein
MVDPPTVKKHHSFNGHLDFLFTPALDEAGDNDVNNPLLPSQWKDKNVYSANKSSLIIVQGWLIRRGDRGCSAMRSSR